MISAFIASTIAFGCMMVLDFIWAHYTLYLVQKRAALAGLFASGIALCNGVVIILVAANWEMIVPTALGAFVGTFYAIKWAKQ